MYPYPSTRPSIFSNIKNISWKEVLDNTGKTLNVINQAIPIIYQVGPIITNARSMMRVASVINEPDTITTPVDTDNNVSKNVFYM